MPSGTQVHKLSSRPEGLTNAWGPASQSLQPSDSNRLGWQSLERGLSTENGALVATICGCIHPKPYPLDPNLDPQPGLCPSPRGCPLLGSAQGSQPASLVGEVVFSLASISASFPLWPHWGSLIHSLSEKHSPQPPLVKKWILGPSCVLQQDNVSCASLEVTGSTWPGGC